MPAGFSAYSLYGSKKYSIKEFDKIIEKETGLDYNNHINIEGGIYGRSI